MTGVNFFARLLGRLVKARKTFIQIPDEDILVKARKAVLFICNM